MKKTPTLNQPCRLCGRQARRRQTTNLRRRLYRQIRELKESEAYWMDEASDRARALARHDQPRLVEERDEARMLLKKLSCIWDARDRIAAERGALRDATDDPHAEAKSQALRWALLTLDAVLDHVDTLSHDPWDDEDAEPNPDTPLRLTLDAP